MSGIGETHTLWEWFVHVTGPLEPCVTREIALVGTLLRGAEMALSGITTVADMMCIAPARRRTSCCFPRARARRSANIHDPYQKLVYCATERDVAQVWVDGEPVVAKGRVLGVDIPALLPHARELAVKLATDAGLDSALARGYPGRAGIDDRSAELAETCPSQSSCRAPTTRSPSRRTPRGWS